MYHSIVKILRRNACMTQKQAAELIGISKRAWEMYEAGSIKPKIQNLKLFALETKQNLTVAIIEAIKNKLKKEKYEHIDGMIKALELTKFEFANDNIVSELNNWIDNTLFSVNEINHLINLDKEVIKNEYLKEIKNIESNYNDSLNFISFNEFSRLLEKYYLS